MTNKIRIFKPVRAPDKVLVNIKKYNHPTGHMVLVGGTLEESKDFVQKLIKPNISPFREGTQTTVEFREFKDGKNGRTASFSFYGHSTPKEIVDFLENGIPDDAPGPPDNECTQGVTPGSTEENAPAKRSRRGPSVNARNGRPPERMMHKYRGPAPEVSITDEDEDSPI